MKLLVYIEKTVVIMIRKKDDIRETMLGIIKEVTQLSKMVCSSEGTTVEEALAEHCRESRFAWITDLPISMVHKREKLKDTSTAAFLNANNFFDNSGCAANRYTLSYLKHLYGEQKSVFQTIDLAVLTKGSDMDALMFESKRPNDYWKRLQNVEPIEAMIGLQYVDSASCSEEMIERALVECSNGQWQIESQLRDAIRSKKENSGLREKPFIWVVLKEHDDSGAVDHIAKMLQHYFGNNVIHKTGAKAFYIGYMPTLNAISLREFYKKG